MLKDNAEPDGYSTGDQPCNGTRSCSEGISYLRQGPEDTLKSTIGHIRENEWHKLHFPNAMAQHLRYVWLGSSNLGSVVANLYRADPLKLMASRFGMLHGN